VPTCSSRRLRADRRRLDRLTAAGWTVLHVTADRLRHDVDRPVRELATVAGW
jgi:very-short-patch-repair endonuclease